MKPDSNEEPPQTLPDLVRDGLDVLFVGINPSVFSAAQGIISRARRTASGRPSRARF